MFREDYKHFNSQISPSDELSSQVLRQAVGYSRTSKNKTKKSTLKIAAGFMAICLCFFATMPLLAANVTPAYQFMYDFSPEMAQFFMPVKKKDTDNGIELKLDSVISEKHQTKIFITLKDLTGNRIDETTDISSAYSLNCPSNYSDTCELIKYNKSTKTATYQITITGLGKHSIAGEKVTFIISSINSRRALSRNLSLPIDLTKIGDALSTKRIAVEGIAGTERFNEDMKEGSAIALTPSSNSIYEIGGIHFTQIAFLDDKLHIQTSLKTNDSDGNFCELYLENPKGEKVYSDYSYIFKDQFSDEGSITYTEFVFNVPPKELSQYSLYGDFDISKTVIKGNWNITFPL